MIEGENDKKQINVKSGQRDNINSEISDLDNKKVLKRVIIFSDAVFAFAITLLILDIHLPTGTVEDNLGPVLISLWHNYLAFLISFFVIYLYWIAHIRLFRKIKRCNWNLILLNYFQLLFIVIIPFSTSVISLILCQLSVIIYAIFIACAGYMSTFLRIYATRNHRLVNENYSSRDIKIDIILMLIAPISFTISIWIALFSVFISQLLWILWIIPRVIIQRIFKYKDPL
ncbi:MAG: TMEM175 family protein [Promethearchaeota archaeon]